MFVLVPKNPVFYERLILLCQIIRKLVMPAGKRVSSAMDGKLKSIHGAWIPAIHAGMTILNCVITKSDKVELSTVILSSDMLTQSKHAETEPGVRLEGIDAPIILKNAVEHSKIPLALSPSTGRSRARSKGSGILECSPNE